MTSRIDRIHAEYHDPDRHDAGASSMHMPYHLVFIFGKASNELIDALEEAYPEFETINILAPVLDTTDVMCSHLPPNTDTTGIVERNAEDMRRRFYPDILGHCALNDCGVEKPAIVYSGTHDDYLVLASQVDPSRCLAIHLDNLDHVDWAHNIWVPVPETRKRLEFIEREITNLMTPNQQKGA